MSEHRKARIIAGTAVAAVVMFVVAALALGGHGSNSGDSASIAGGTAAPGHGPVAFPPSLGASTNSAAAPAAAGSAPASAGSTVGDSEAESAADLVTATRVVKTGNLDLRVPRGQVQTTVSKLVALTTAMGGYVSQSQTDTVLGSPTGELTLRMPAAQFDGAVSGAEALGHVMSLTTSSHDVTGQVVDLGARLGALEQTRSTYLTILGRAKTIGATLEVQQRVDDVQQQIEELQGQLKVLNNQSTDGTLTVDVTQDQPVATVVVVHHHKQSGIGKAWHTSVSRFTRGIDAIVSALGPLLLAILILAALLGIGRLGYRGVRRATS